MGLGLGRVARHARAVRRCRCRPSPSVARWKRRGRPVRYEPESARTSPAESSCREFLLNPLLSVAQYGESLLAIHRAKCFEVVIQRKVVGEVLEQRLDWQSRAAEHRFAAENARVTYHQPAGGLMNFSGCIHPETLTHLPALAKWCFRLPLSQTSPPTPPALGMAFLQEKRCQN